MFIYFNLLSLLNQPIEYELAKKLGGLPLEIQQVATNYKPHVLANYLLEVAQIFNKFYAKCRIMGTSDEIQQARLLLADATRIVLAKGLGLLGIEAPKEM